MKTLSISIFMILLITCNIDTGKKKMKMDLNTKNFSEGTVGTIEGHKVMFSNIMIQDYTLEDGTNKQGAAASLSLPNSKEWLTVGAGSTFLLDGKKYEVIEVTEDSPGQVLVRL